MTVLSYEKFSRYFDRFERLNELSKQRELSDIELSKLDEAGIYISTLPVDTAKLYLNMKIEQLNRGLKHCNQVLLRLKTQNNDNFVPK